MNTTEVKLTNLTCEACVKLSQKKIGKIDGVREVRISDINGNTQIIADRVITREEIQAALSGTDYGVI